MKTVIADTSAIPAVWRGIISHSTTATVGGYQSDNQFFRCQHRELSRVQIAGTDTGAVLSHAIRQFLSIDFLLMVIRDQ